MQTGDNVLIGGFIVTGTDSKRVIVRGIGPSLTSSGVSGALADTTLELFQGGTLLASNDNWKESQQAEIEETTIPPTNGMESAIVRTLPPGAYTVILRGKNNLTGIGLIEGQKSLPKFRCHLRRSTSVELFRQRQAAAKVSHAGFQGMSPPAYPVTAEHGF